MSKQSFGRKTLATVAFTFAAAFGLNRPASAAPILGQFINDARGDVVANQNSVDELGDQLNFPANESILYSATATALVTSVPNDGNPNDWVVRILNTSGQSWKNLFFVADVGATVGNADGVVQDVVGAPGVFTDAFRIDGTVTGGVNINLLSESGTVDEIFQPGEIWDFLVTNFNVGTAFLPPVFNTPGVFAGSSPLNAGVVTNASIIASPVPEPASLSALGIAAVGMLARRRRR